MHQTPSNILWTVFYTLTLLTFCWAREMVMAHSLDARARCSPARPCTVESGHCKYSASVALRKPLAMHHPASPRRRCAGAPQPNQRGCAQYLRRVTAHFCWSTSHDASFVWQYLTRGHAASLLGVARHCFIRTGAVISAAAGGVLSLLRTIN